MYYYNYLAHHGVKGQKWGVRRYENADGSLTPAGKIRYGADGRTQGNRSSNKTKKQGMSVKKKVAIGAAAVGGLALTAAASTAIKRSATAKVQRIGQDAVKDYLKDAADYAGHADHYAKQQMRNPQLSKIVARYTNDAREAMNTANTLARQTNDNANKFKKSTAAAAAYLWKTRKIR